MVAVLALVLAWFAAAPASPYSAVPEVILARKVTVALFWKARPRALAPPFSRPGVTLTRPSLASTRRLRTGCTTRCTWRA